jgi:undecaprenyl diphosphate synthase
MKRIPQHIAIIMDGNGRWARERGLPRAEGHRQGAEAIEKIVAACRERNVRYLTLYTFSEENWNRPSEEILALMQLLRHFLISKRQEMMEKGIRFRTIGEVEKLPSDVQAEIVRTREATAGGDRMDLVVALSYGSKQEICRAVNSVIRRGSCSITPEVLAGELDTAGIPDPDLLIRTSGEYRISNFLLWQLAYAELYFTDTLWPDFDEAELDRAIDSFSERERRFGLTSEQLKKQQGGVQ